MHKRIRDRWLLNLGLLAAVILLSIALLIDREKQQPVEQTLATILPTDINKIRIVRSGKADIQFEKRADTWLMTAPYTIKADPVQVDNLLSIRLLRINTELDSPSLELSEFGLQTPHSALELNNTRINFGDTQPVDSQRYLLLNDKVMLVNDTMQELLNTSSLSFIDRQLVPVGTAIKAVRVNNQPVDLLSAWADTRAIWISLYAGDKIEGIPVEIQLKNESTTINFHLQKREADAVLIRDEPKIEYHISHSTMQTLGLGPASEPADSNNDPDQ